ncbi:AsmA-like C-terminal region-containing protein [Methylobacterium crusticola]|uniref:AsmA-like C-terminal region-containing protein n=1 Tax=Methylobacterium crusticola TaxID=1697972 RepID=UPI001EE199DE|nr:hypothetical protein [Methylobacterium crusticola]
MRDILTALAGLVILILAAALIAPPFIPWEAQRAVVDAALSRSLGVEARSDGRLEIRLLPSPRLRVDHLVLATGRDRPALDARFVKAELALTPLLSGEMRFTETRIGRGEVTLPMTEAGSFLRPPPLEGRDLAVEDLRVAQLLLTTVVAATGRTDQLYAENVRLAAPRLAGPWRAEGEAGAVPFRIVTGAPGPDGAVPVKVAAGGDTVPRLEVDARVALSPEADGGEVPEASGSARLVVGPPAQAAGAALPLSLQGSFKARGRLAAFDGLTLELPGDAPLRLAGRGTLDAAAARASLALEARRLDLDAFLAGPSGQALLARGLGALGFSLPGFVALDVAAESAAFARDEWSGIALGAVLRPSGAVTLRRLEATAPGGTRIALNGDVSVSGGFSGHVAVQAPASDRLARLADRLGFASPLLRLLDGRPFAGQADVAAALPDVSLRNARVALGAARLTGSARYVPAGPDGERPRFDAQIVADGLDVAELPPLRGVVDALQDHDVGLTLLARDLRYGPAGPRTGEIAASLQSEGAALRLDSLEVRDLAGAQVSLSGRIGPDGAGRIAGRLSAPVAAPLVDLLARTFVEEARYLPAFLRDGPVALDVTLERDPGGAEEGRLRSHARGSAAGGRLGLALVTRAGRIDSLDARLDGVASGRWLGRPDDPALKAPASLRLGGRRAGEAGAPLALTVEAELAGAALSTTRPLALQIGDVPLRDGEILVASPDLRPLAGLLGRAPAVQEPVPARVTVAFGASGSAPRLALAGTVAGGALEATLSREPGGPLAGSASLDRLSLPWLASALVLGQGPAGAEPWPAGRFGPAPAPPPARLAVAARRLDLGRGLVAEGARFGLAVGPEGLTLRDFEAGLAGGRLTGTATLARQGDQATVAGEGVLTAASIQALVGGDAIRGQASLRLRLGAAGDSVAALVGNLAGSGGLELAGLGVRDLDPAAVDRALGRLLAEEDPLRAGRVERVVAEEFARGPLSVPGPVAVPASLVGGVLRTGSLALDLGPSSWSGLVQVDLRTLRLDARGTLTAQATPRAWTAPPPTLGLALAGPLARPVREVDVVPLSNLLAAVVLQRELDKIETIEADRNERARRQSRLEMDRARAVEEARQSLLRAEEAARQRAQAAVDAAARLRAEQAAAAEAARLRAEQAAAAEAARLRAEQAAAAEAARLRAEEEARARDAGAQPAETSQ